MTQGGRFKLDSGRDIRLYSLNQTLTNFGWLEGAPDQKWNDNAIQGVMAGVKQRCGNHCILIPPVRRLISLGEPSGPFRVERELLPSVTCIGNFESWSPAKDHSRDCSYLTIVWFQDEFGLPTDPEILQQLRAVDWNELALDGDL